MLSRGLEVERLEVPLATRSEARPVGFVESSIGSVIGADIVVGGVEGLPSTVVGSVLAAGLEMELGCFASSCRACFSSFGGGCGCGGGVGLVV